MRYNGTMNIPSYSFSSSFKAVQNFIIGENIARKSTQLADDLALIKAREADPEGFAQANEQELNTSKTSFNTRIEQSINDILDIRERLGMLDSNARDEAYSSLKDFLSPEKGSNYNNIL